MIRYDTQSWSSLKHDLYGLKFYYAKVLDKPWPGADLVKPPKSFALPDIITVSQAQQIFTATRVLSYRIFFFTLYSLGLRLQVEDIDADRMRVQIRNARGNPVLLFPNRHGGLKNSYLATTPLDRGGIQTTLRQVARDCGLKKELHRTACATAMRSI